MPAVVQAWARLRVVAAIGPLDPNDERGIARRIARAEHALTLLRACRHEFPRAIWRQQEVIGRLRVRPMRGPGRTRPFRAGHPGLHGEAAIENRRTRVP